MTQPSVDQWYALDADTIRTAYLKAKAARLVGAPDDRVTHLASLSTSITQTFLVRGDSGRRYRVWLRTTTTPWMAACSRGGIHDFQRDGQACSHGLAAAVAWELAKEATPA